MIRKERLLQTFLDLVQIDSPSGEEQKIAKEMIRRLEALGGSVERDAFGNIIAKFKGVGDPMMINAHLDTVEPGRGIKPVIHGDRITSDGRTILGGDPKAGVAAILEVLTSLKEEKHKHVPLEVVFTMSEEIGLKGAVNLDYSKLTAKKGITFDGDGGVGTVTTSAPGYNRVDVTIIGRGAHAGVEPEKGISAIKIGAEIISKLEIGRIDHETTANVGLIEGGSALNAVPERLHFMAEIRSRSLQKLEKHSLHFEEIFNAVMQKYQGAKIELKIVREFDPYLFKENHSVIQKIKNVLSQLGLKPKLELSGGGTDVNIFHTHGIEVVCVGVGDYGAHTTKEYALISEMIQTARFCEKIVKI
ncbi:M20/M25/M40 family metallo-hydrolase [Patescibacteria group bacterium]|nr:M20/M25/M40 family metallo-hydrolase [Patescibacteria group bacterium]